MMNTVNPVPPDQQRRRGSEPLGTDVDTLGPLTTTPTRRLKTLGLVVLLVVLFGIVAGLLPRLRQRAALREENRELAVPTVAVVLPVASEGGPGLTLPAEVKPLMETIVYARANGYLKRWLVDLGATVVAGQLLAEIDTPEINQELLKSRAELAQAEASRTLARTTAERWIHLVKNGSVSLQESAEKEADLALKSAIVDGARANVNRLEELQSFSRVTAPFAGVITARKADTGDLINNSGNSNSKELFRLAQTDTLRVFVHVPQTAARGVAPGTLAELTVPELAGQVFQAKVVRQAGIMETGSRTMLVELEVTNEKRQIMAGSYAQVRFQEATSEAVLTLPANSILFRAEGPQVALVQSDGTVELRRVELGRDFGPTIEILSGLKATDSAVLNPMDSLANGAKVRVAEPPQDQKPAHRSTDANVVH